MNHGQTPSSMERPLCEVNWSRLLAPKPSKHSAKERTLLFFSSHWKRSFSLSSLLGERTIPPLSLLMRGHVPSVFSVFKPENNTKPLTVLLSCIAVCTWLKIQPILPWWDSEVDDFFQRHILRWLYGKLSTMSWILCKAQSMSLGLRLLSPWMSSFSLVSISLLTIYQVYWNLYLYLYLMFALISID